VEVADSAQEAVGGADIICTVTTSRQPVVLGRWVSEGAHINAVGGFSPSTRELDTEAVARARLYVDRREATLAESGEFLLAKREGAIGDDHIVAEQPQLESAHKSGRSAPNSDEITLFKSLGVAIEDLAAAHHIWRKAHELKTGTWIAMGGQHFGSQE
jgi:ornithine cyclodeaminase